MIRQQIFHSFIRDVKRMLFMMGLLSDTLVKFIRQLRQTMQSKIVFTLQ